MPKFHIICCQNYSEEVQSFVDKMNVPDIEVHYFEALCGSKKRFVFPERFNEAIRNREKTVSVGCLFNEADKKIRPVELDGTGNKRTNVCFDHVLPPEMVTWYFSQGYYVITPGWLKNWQFYVQSLWQFKKQEDASEFFQSSARKLLVLNTLNQNFIPEKIKEFSEYTGLPFEILPVGNHFIENYLKISYLDWKENLQNNRLKNITTDYQKQLADYVFTLEIIKRITSLTDEEQIIKKAKEFFITLFSPNSVEYVNIAGDKLSPDEMEISGTSKIHESGDGFSICTLKEGKPAGMFSVNKVLFPEHVNQYFRLSMFVGNVLSLSLENAVRYQELKSTINKLDSACQIADEANSSKDRLFSIVAHDLRSPISLLVGYLNYVKTNFDELSKSEIKDIINQLDENANSLMDFLIRLLDWTKIQLSHHVANPVSIHPFNIIRDELVLLQNHASKKDIYISLKVPENLQMWCDEQMFAIMIRNLISNALKFSPTGKPIMINGKTEEGQTKISVQDFGLGMTKEQQESAFKTMATTTGTLNEKGTGLGLITCYLMAKKNHGTILLKSKPGIGSTFTLILPAKAEV